MKDLTDLEKEVAEKIIEKLELDVRLEDISYTAPLFAAPEGSEEQSVGLDSVDGLELVVMLYESWGIKVKAEEMPSLTTIERIADFVRQKLAAEK